MRLVETRPVVREGVIKFLCNRVREADQQLEGIALYPIEVRLARLFLTTARQKGGAKPGPKVVLDLPISQSELALLIGAGALVYFAIVFASGAYTLTDFKRHALRR